MAELFRAYAELRTTVYPEAARASLVDMERLTRELHAAAFGAEEPTGAALTLDGGHDRRARPGGQSDQRPRRRAGRHRGSSQAWRKARDWMSTDDFAAVEDAMSRRVEA